MITSERLTLREFTLADTEFILELFNQKDCLKYIGDKQLYSHFDAIKYLKEGPIASYKINGFGLLAVCLPSNEVIGACGLLKREGLELPDLGFALLTRFYRRGYAFEASQSVLSFYHNIEQVLALTHPENVISQALLERLGFSFKNQQASLNSNQVSNIYQWSRKTMN